MTRRAHRWAIAGAAILAAAAGCAQDDGSRFSPIDLVVPNYTDDDLRQLGMDTDQEIQEYVEIIYDPVVSGYVNELGQQLASQIDPQPFIYRFRVIKAGSLNAFAIPGGYIYIHSETLAQVSSVDELAGVLTHEIAHVQARHFSRREEQTALPGLAARVLGIGAAIATQEPGLVLMGEGINVSLEIGYTREFEAEADKLGAIWMTRAGYDAAGMTRFLDRIAQSADRFPDSLPPYLATHPFPEDRIHTINAAAENLHPRNQPDPELAEALPRVQARLAHLMRTGRSIVGQEIASSGDPEIEAALLESERLAATGDTDGALLVLGRVDRVELSDPRVPFRVADLLYERGRYAEAADSYLRTIQQDPSRALVFFKLGLAFRGADQRHRAVYAFEQAALRTHESSVLKQRAEWEIFKLTFASIQESGFADTSNGDGFDSVLESTETEFAEGVSRLAWWARIGSRFVEYSDDFEVRWTDPSGKVAQDDDAKDREGNLISSELELDDGETMAAGRWTVELVLEDDVLDRRTLMIRPQPGGAPRPL